MVRCFPSSGLHVGLFVAGRLAATAASDPQGSSVGISFHIPEVSMIMEPASGVVSKIMYKALETYTVVFVIIIKHIIGFTRKLKSKLGIRLYVLLHYIK